MKKLICKAQEDSVVLVLLGIVSFLLGLVIGFYFSPVKGGLTIASNNVITNTESDDDDDDEE